MVESLYKVKVIRITVQNGVLAQLLSCQLYNTIYYNVDGQSFQYFTVEVNGNWKLYRYFMQA